MTVRYDLLRTRRATRRDARARLRHEAARVPPTSRRRPRARSSRRSSCRRRRVGTLYVLHVLDPALTGEKLRRAEEGAEFQLTNLRAMARGARASPRSAVIRRGEPAHAILAEVDERRVTGIIVGHARAQRRCRRRCSAASR